ncbi:RpiB/LacA/LacB family sugar-phosphate isomerase [Candidatus Saccharibacteria bacterium]|nr:RpiB/LacA/LacB family sugar-phosphate isomerase [Candidatus Saccharibacteria bacterium]
MTIYLGADHAGYELKTQLSEHLVHSGHQVEDLGAKTLDADDDYPRYAYYVASKILGGDDDDRGILICGSGQGMSMAANRVNGVRAALAWNEATAASAMADDDANVLVLPSRHVDAEQAIKMVDAWLAAEFKSDPKYRRRLDELEELYG